MKLRYAVLALLLAAASTRAEEKKFAIDTVHSGVGFSALSFSLDVHPLRLQGDATGDDFTFMATAGFATNPICVADRVLEWLPSGILIQPN